MTKEQVERYQEIEAEIRPLKGLMEFCGKKYREPQFFNPWKMIIRRFCQVIRLSGRGLPECYTDVAVPKELQTEIVEVIENYIERREKEMEEL